MTAKENDRIKERKQKRSGGRRRRNRPFLRSISSNITVAIILMVILVVLVASFFYRQQLNGYLTDTHTQQLTRVGNLLYKQATDRYESLGDLTKSTNWKNNMEFGRDSVSAYIWLVSPQGVVIQSTGFPDTMKLTTVDPRTGRVLLPETCIGNDTPSEGYIYVGGNYFGLFNRDNLTWLSYVRPVFSTDGEKIAILQIHRPLDFSGDRRDMILNGLFISMLVAFAIGMAIVFFASQRLVKPLRELSDAAIQVSQGNLDVRIPVDEDEVDEGLMITQDELSVLRHTFNDMVEKLNNMNSDRRDMISSISHDIRTPLTSIQGFVSGMLDGTIPPDRYPRYLNIVAKETKRMQNLINQMHDMVLLESNGINYNFVNFDLQALISEVIHSLETQLSEKHLTVQTNFPRPKEEKDRLIVYGDKQQIERVIQNLLTNAIKFTPDGGVISISVQRPNLSKLARVIVEDNGKGLSEDELNLVFNRFYKSDRSRTGHKGSGLGLYITRQILAAHGQHISASNSAMGGAKFSFTLQAV